MKHWRMRTTLMVSLLAVSLGLTAMCLFIIRFSVKQQIRKNLDADLSHSLSTFRSISAQRNEMLAREASLLADLPSLKALMATQDPHTIQDGSSAFWTTSGTDFFALVSSTGDLLTFSNRGSPMNDQRVARGIKACMYEAETTCLVSFNNNLYELSTQSLSFGPPANGSQLGYVVIGYAIDQQIAHQISEVASADVAFVIDGKISVSTLPNDRLADLRLHTSTLASTEDTPESLQLKQELYVAATSTLPAAGKEQVKLVVLKSYDQASLYLRRVNRWILTLGICSLFIGLLLAAGISRTVTRPLEALVAGARALGRGDFSFQLSTDGAVEVRELASAFERMRDELQRSQKELLESDRLATIGRMASSVSHDLRHHLSTIYANAEFMSLEYTGEEDRVELLQEVKEGVQGMTDLIESLLLFSQTGQALQLQAESIPQLLARTVHTVRQHPECRDVGVSIDDSHPILESAEVWVDGPKLSRAFYNLLLNACQAAKLGSGAPVVGVSIAENAEQIRISVSDSGPGVPSSIRDRLFQPFVSAGKVNGTGLGLAVAQHIVQEHGGEIILEQSILGKTVFSLILYKTGLQILGRMHVVNANFDTDASVTEPNGVPLHQHIASSQERI